MKAKSKKHPRAPHNFSDTLTTPDYSGFLIIRLKPGVVSFRCDYGKQKKGIMLGEVILAYLRKRDQRSEKRCVGDPLNASTRRDRILASNCVGRYSVDFGCRPSGFGASIMRNGRRFRRYWMPICRPRRS
jgi:hypothetical protein